MKWIKLAYLPILSCMHCLTNRKDTYPIFRQRAHSNWCVITYHVLLIRKEFKSIQFFKSCKCLADTLLFTNECLILRKFFELMCLNALLRDNLNRLEFKLVPLIQIYYTLESDDDYELVFTSRYLFDKTCREIKT